MILSSQNSISQPTLFSVQKSSHCKFKRTTSRSSDIKCNPSPKKIQWNSPQLAYIKPSTELSSFNAKLKDQLVSKLSRFTQKQYQKQQQQIKNEGKKKNESLQNSGAVNKNNQKSFQQIIYQQEKLRIQAEKSCHSLQVLYDVKVKECLALNIQIKEKDNKIQILNEELSYVNSLKAQIMNLWIKIQDLEADKVRKQNQIDQLQKNKLKADQIIFTITQQLSQLKNRSKNINPEQLRAFSEVQQQQKKNNNYIKLLFQKDKQLQAANQMIKQYAELVELQEKRIEKQLNKIQSHKDQNYENKVEFKNPFAHKINIFNTEEKKLISNYSYQSQQFQQKQRNKC